MQKADEQKVFMTVKEAARYVGVSPETMWRDIRKGYGPPVKYFGNRIRIPVRRFFQWCEVIDEKTPRTANGK